MRQRPARTARRSPAECTGPRCWSACKGSGIRETPGEAGLKFCGFSRPSCHELLFLLLGFTTSLLFLDRGKTPPGHGRWPHGVHECAASAQSDPAASAAGIIAANV